MISFVTAIAILLIGFSICSSLLLAITHFNKTHYQELVFSRYMGFFMLAGLCGLQIAHFFWLYADQDWIPTGAYSILLFVIAPAFFLFSQPILISNKQKKPTLIDLVHLIPIAVSPFLASWLALPLAFLLGAIYLVWLAFSLFRLRSEQENFKQEIFLLGGVFVIAVVVAILGFLRTSLQDKLFFSFYSIAIGLAFLLVQIALGLRPDLSHEVSETARYTSTTLNKIDCASALSTLEKLMQIDKIYTDAELGLAELARRLELNTHQTSELMNVKLGKSFSRYLREQRINAAKVMLKNEVSASVLSIGLNVGFSSQSGFYEAFREIEGMPPGQYRKLISSSSTS
ncbi:helix-turn-helix domain-containing protein [Undibacterium sp. SXout11W]|uniref:helix-turn-helix domain-containing protein n=1 Tax=Undibacterium sp. SXout11W TaxID=3413050 RepID=UPI003BF28216